MIVGGCCFNKILYVFLETVLEFWSGRIKEALNSNSSNPKIYGKHSQISKPEEKLFDCYVTSIEVILRLCKNRGAMGVK